MSTMFVYHGLAKVLQLNLTPGKAMRRVAQHNFWLLDCQPCAWLYQTGITAQDLAKK